MKIYIGADHNGFALKAELIKTLTSAGYDVTDEGSTELDPKDDFTKFANKVVYAMRASKDRDPRGILICGSGQGMCMAANRFKGIRAGLVWNLEGAKAARNDSDSNVICLSADQLSTNQAVKLVEAWLAAPFAGAARFKRRIRELDQLG